MSLSPTVLQERRIDGVFEKFNGENLNSNHQSIVSFHSFSKTVSKFLSLLEGFS